MHPSLCLGLAWLLWCSSSVSLAAAPPACVDRLAAPSGARSDFDRIPQMQYECVRLGSGAHVWIAQAGPATAPPVLMVHGMGNNAHRDWRRTVPALQERFRVIVLDLPGFGASPSLEQGHSFEGFDRILQELRSHLALPRFHLVGHSLGAAFSLYVAHRHPEQIERLVLVDAAGILLKPVFVKHLLEANSSALGLGPLSGLLGELGKSGEGSLMALLEDEGGLSRALLQNAAVRSALFGMEAHADAALGLVEHDFTAAVRELRTPTVVLWGSEDTITPLRTGQLLAARLPLARLQTVGGAQHMPMIQRPEAFNGALLSALSDPVERGADPVPKAAGEESVTCTNRSGMRYSGAYRRITLENCANVLIENARVGQLSAQGSSVTLINTVIDSSDVALQVRASSIVATAVDIVGRVAISAQDSTLDLAGVRVQGGERALDVMRSRAYFSVSDVQGPEHRGAMHGVWSRPAAPEDAALP